MFDDDDTTPEEIRLAQRRAAENAPVEEAGGGVSEGFEQAEEELIEHASHGDQHTTAPIMRDARDEVEPDSEESAEADHVRFESDES